MSLDGPATDIFIADPTIADIQIAAANRIFAFGRKAGRTSLYALGAEGRIIKSIVVEVRNQTARAQQMIAARPT